MCMSAYHWIRIEADARLLSRKLNRRTQHPYTVTGWGEGDGHSTVTMTVTVQADSEAQALSQVMSDCPGCVVTTCRPADGAKGDVLRASVPVNPDAVSTARTQLRQIAEHSAAHTLWMESNRRAGRTDDAAARELHRLHPWPEVTPAYPVTR